MALYRDYNSPAAAMAAYQSDFGATLVEPSSNGVRPDVRRLLGNRNLRMVANIRDVLSQHPGRRMLAIVGCLAQGLLRGLPQSDA